MLYLIHFPLSGLPSTHSSSFPLFFLCRVFHWPSIILPSSFIMSHSTTVLLLSGIQDDFTFVLLRFYWGGDLQDDFTFVLLCCYWRVSDLQNISHSFYCVVIGEWVIFKTFHILLCCYWREWSSRRFHIRSTACYWRVSDLQDISHFKEMLRPYYYHIVSLQCSPLSLYNFISRKIPTQRTDR